MAMANWMIYGANGYTGKLIAQEAKARGMTPILGGRSPEIAKLAGELGLESRQFALGSGQEIAKNLAGVSLVLHCAGPFSSTSRPMLDGCIAARAHYLDITGEVAVFESIFDRDAEIKRAGIVAMPGVGFDVVPTDCMARLLKDELPSATSLKMAFKGGAAVSAGTAKSMIEGMRVGAIIRRSGKLVALPLGAKTLQIPFKKSRPEPAILIAWGDVSTAFRTTGIPDIEIYTGGTPGQARGMRVMGVLTRPNLIQGLMKSLAGKLVKGPGQEARSSGRVYVWGEARDAAGKSVSRRLILPEGYHFTIQSSLLIAKRLLAGTALTGALTPAGAFGAGLVREVPGVELETVEPQN